MRLTLAAAVLVAAFPVAHAATSVSVPTFSIDYVSSDWYNEPHPDPLASFTLVSTNAASTVLSLDSLVEGLHAVGTGTQFGMLQSEDARFRLQAGAGYRITSVTFTATVAGKLAPLDLPPEAVSVKPGAAFNTTAGYADIVSVGGGPNATARYKVEQVVSPTTVSFTIENTGDLSAFDLLTEVLGSAHSTVTYWNLPGDPLGTERRGYGPAELHYLDATLTVHTAVAAVPEPGQWAMLAGGLLVLGASAVRRSRG